MTESTTTVALIAVLLCAAVWLSVRMAAVSDQSLLSMGCRRRMLWFGTHARHLYAGCALVAVAMLVLGLNAG